MSHKNLIGFVVMFGVLSPAMAVEKTVDATQARALKMYSVTPVVFIENVGQIADPTVRYVFRGSGANIFHTTKGPVVQLFERGKISEQLNRRPRIDEKNAVRRVCSFSMKFIGAGQVRPTGRSKQETKVNYFIGGDPKKWYTDVTTYSEVVYPELYDGISLHTFGRRSNLKYEFHIEAGADYKQIIVTYEGAGGMKIDSNGALHVNTPFGELVDEVPYIYQIIDGGQVQIPGRYRLIDENSYTFDITGDIQPTTELVIDPQLSWICYLGGSSNETGYGVAVDPATGDVLLTGVTNSDEFPTTSGVYQLGRSAQTDAFVAKIGSDGQLLWATYLGGTGEDAAYGVAVDSLGYVLLTGNTDSPTYSFPTTYGAIQRDNKGGTDAFITKLNSFGSALYWSTLLGGGGNDNGNGIAVDANDAVLLTGDTNSADFPTTPGKPYWAYTGQTDAFVAKVTQNPHGYPVLQWCQCRGGDDDDWGYAIAVDMVGNSFVVGATASQYGFSMTNPLQNFGGGIDVLVAKLDTFGNIEGSVDPWGFCSYLGGNSDDVGYGIATGQDEGGRYVLLTGYTESTDFPASGGFDSSYCCCADAYVARINYTTPTLEPVKPVLVWGSYLGGGVNDVGRCIAIVGKDDVSPPEIDDYALVTGFTSSYNFPTPEAFDPNYNGLEDAFLTKVTSSGQLVWSSYLGGSGNDRAYGVAVDGQGGAFLTGVTDSNDLPVEGGGNHEPGGAEDVFVAKISKDKMIGTGKLHGTVWDPDGGRIADADVTVQGQTAITDGEGHFSFDSDDDYLLTSDLFAGQTVVMVNKDTDFYPVAKIINVDVNSTTYLNIRMTEKLELNEPSVADVRSRYCGPGKHPYYLHGPSLREKFIATVDWGLAYDPNKNRKIVWQTPLGGYVEDIISGDLTPGLGRVSHYGRCFDMGSDFGVGNNWLKVTAIAYDPIGRELSSDQKVVSSFEIIEPPPFISPDDANNPDVVKVVFTGEGFEYKMLIPDFNMATWSEENQMPMFKGEGMNVELDLEENPKPCDSRLSATVKKDGTSFVFTKGCDGGNKVGVHKEVPVGGIDLPKLPHGIEVEVSATADFYLTYQQGADPPWAAGGGLDVACIFSFSSPYYYVAVIGPVPVYSKAEVSLALGLSSNLEGWIGTGPTLSSSFYFEPLLKGILAAGIADVASVEGYLGGGFHAEVELFPELQWGGQYIILVGGVDVYVGPTSVAGGELRYSWWPNPGESFVIHEREFGSVGTEYRVPGVQAVLGINGINERMVEPNEFPYCVPKLVRLEDGGITDNMLMVWLHDDPNEHSSDRTKLRYATYHNADWIDHGAVDVGDTTADMNPQLIPLVNGDAVCIWQDARASLADCCDLQTFNSRLEIAVRKYNFLTNTWSDMGLINHRLTDDIFLDRSPKLAAADGSRMLAVWIKNESNDMWGNAGTAPNKIIWSHCDGGSWTEPDMLCSDCEAILGTALAYDPNTAAYTYVFSLDFNDADSAVNLQQQELFLATYSSSGGWSGPHRLTSDDVGDAAPRLIYDSNSNKLLLFWIRQDQVRMAEGSRFLDYSSFDPDTDSNMVPSPAGIKDFDVVMGRQGQIALVFNDVSVPLDFPEKNPNLFRPECIEPKYIRDDPEHYDPDRLPVYMNPECIDPNLIMVNHDIWLSYRDPCFGYWSMPGRLTWDDASERSMSTAFESDGALLCVYNKRQTEYENVACYEDCRCNEPNHHPVNVAKVPVAGKRSDLVCLNDALRPDLSIEVEDVKVQPPNPLPGTWAKVSANVKNLGISPAHNIDVCFSDDSVAGGIWDPPVQPVVGPLVGGAESEVSVWWKVPPSVSPRTITVEIISFDGKPEDPNRMDNNRAEFKILAPDLTIREMDVYSTGSDTRVVTVRVANDGVLPVGSNYLLLRESDPGGRYNPYGQILCRRNIEDIEPVAYRDIPLELSSAQLDGVNKIYAEVDTVSFFVVDTFELYASDLNDVNRGLPYLHDVWEGLPDIPNGGVAVLETYIVSTGEQSMQFWYDNTGGPNSVLRHVYDLPQDWTSDGIETLRLHFYGDETNTAEGMSVTLKDSDGDNATIEYDGEPGDLTAKVWLQWDIDLRNFTADDIDTGSIVAIELCITGGTTGGIYFDDILLYSFPYVTGDITGDYIVDFEDLRILAWEWLSSGDKADLLNDDRVDFRDFEIMAGQWLWEFEVQRPDLISPVYNVREFNEDNNINSVTIRPL